MGTDRIKESLGDEAIGIEADPTVDFGWDVTRTAVQPYGYRCTFGSDRGRSEPSDS